MEETRQSTVRVHDVSPVYVMLKSVAVNGSGIDSLSNGAYYASFRYLCLYHTADNLHMI